MKRYRFVTLILCFWLVACGSEQPSSSQASYQAIYTVNHYEATFAPLPAGATSTQDVSVTLVIGYNITQGSKGEGFKYVGEQPVTDVRVTDGQGEPLRFDLHKEREYKITWYFDPVMQGEQEVIVSFMIPSAYDPASRSFVVDWVKNWRVPVYDVTYRWSVPEDSVAERWQMTPPATLILFQGEQALEAHLAQLSGEVFRVWYQ